MRRRVYNVWIMRLDRRSFLWFAAAPLLARERLSDRLGVACVFGAEEKSARASLAAARAAGFRMAQIRFPWDRVTPEYLRALPSWLRGEDIRADVLSAYVNCCNPGNVIMNCRAEDFPRAIELAGTIGARYLAAWTGGYGKGLLQPDPRNFGAEAEGNICRFLEPHLKRIEDARLTVALETFITLACPDAPSLARLLKGLPACAGAVMDPPNLTPVSRYSQRDQGLREMFSLLRDRTAIVHLKDFRLAPGGQTYEMPGALMGEMSYPLFIEQIRALPGSPPLVAEHISERQFAETRRRLLPLLGGSPA